MSYNINITDLFDNNKNVNNDTPFILIHSDNINKLLEKSDSDSNSSIYNFNKNLIYNILKDSDLNPDYFVYLYHIYLENNADYPDTIVLGNINKNTKYPIDFIFIKSYSDGTVWMPVTPDGFGALGLIYNHGVNKPNTNIIGVVDVNYLTNIYKLNFANDGLTSVNEFKALTHPSNKQVTIVRGKSYKGVNKFKILDYDGKYISSDYSHIKLLGKDRSHDQHITYDIQGKLIVGDKCMTVNDNSNDVLLQTCYENNIKQIWYPVNNNLISQYKNTDCLTSSSDSVVTKKCDGSNEQKWTYEEPTSVDQTEYIWGKNKGRTVVLVDSDNPWYVNKDITDQIHFDTKQQDLNNVEYKSTADFTSDFVIDSTKSHMGYGHSYASRQGVPCKIDSNGNRIIEGFSNYDNIDWINIIIIILIALLLLFIIIRNN